MSASRMQGESVCNANRVTFLEIIDGICLLMPFFGFIFSSLTINVIYLKYYDSVIVQQSLCNFGKLDVWRIRV